ncbi:unnamed protein product, partial [Ceratitis capitata]
SAAEMQQRVVVIRLYECASLDLDLISENITKSYSLAGCILNIFPHIDLKSYGYNLQRMASPRRQQ